MAAVPAFKMPDIAHIQTYFDETWPDYKVIWMSRAALAFHFGYWDANTQSHAESLINRNRELGNSLGIRSGQRILDAGCGVGGSSIWLAQEYDVEVVGITVVRGQVMRARRYAQERGVADRVTFYQQDFTRTAFRDASFDVVWALESVVHAPDMRPFLAEARRLLRPGGRLGISEGMRTNRQVSAADEALLRAWLSGWAVPDLLTSDEWMHLTKEAGFCDMQFTDITFNVRPSLNRLYQLSKVWRPIAVALFVLGLISDLHYANWRGARNQWHALERRLWIMGTLTASKP
jgi:tocopherol O-methyltransferase